MPAGESGRERCNEGLRHPHTSSTSSTSGTRGVIQYAHPPTCGSWAEVLQVFAPPHKHTLIQLTRPSYLGLQASSRRTPTQADSGLKGLTREEAGAAAGAAAAAGRAARGNPVLPLQLASLCLAAFAQANVVTHTGPRTGPRLTTPWRLWQQRVRGGGAGGGVEEPGAP